MLENDSLAEITKILKYLQEDWFLVDDLPEKDFLVFVNADRDVLKDFLPNRNLIKQIEIHGLIKNYDAEFPPQPETYSYFVKYGDAPVEEVFAHNPHVYFYRLTAKGINLLLQK